MNIHDAHPEKLFQGVKTIQTFLRILLLLRPHLGTSLKKGPDRESQKGRIRLQIYK